MAVIAVIHRSNEPPEAAMPCAPYITAATSHYHTAARSSAGEQPQRALLLEVQGPAGRGGNAAEPAPEVGHRGPDTGLGQHPHAERQRRRADVVAPLELER